jgi:hypothetical protein
MHNSKNTTTTPRSRETGEMFAIKTIRKSKVSRLDSLRREIDILQTVDHPQIIKVRVGLFGLGLVCCGCVGRPGGGRGACGF